MLDQNDMKNVFYGTNSMRDLYDGCCYGTHAEMDLVRRLNKFKPSRKTTIDIIVINITKEGKLKNSKPCEKCIECMVDFCKKTKYHIRHIYYSKIDGTIGKTSLKSLHMEKNKFVSTRFRNKK